MAYTTSLFAAAWALTLAGGIVVLGALGALTNDSEVTPLFGPYRLCWVGWSLEVVGLLLALYALAVGPFQRWRPTFLYSYAAVTGFLIPITNDVFVNTSALPGSNGSSARAYAAGAGLIIVLAGNWLQAILSALHEVDEPRAVHHNGSGSAKEMA